MLRLMYDPVSGQIADRLRKIVQLSQRWSVVGSLMLAVNRVAEHVQACRTTDHATSYATSRPTCARVAYISRGGHVTPCVTLRLLAIAVARYDHYPEAVCTPYSIAG